MNDNDFFIIGNDINGSVILGGNSTTDAPPPEIAAALTRSIANRNDLKPGDKEDLRYAFEKIVYEAAKGESADVSRLNRLLKTVTEIAPDVLNTVVSTLTNPIIRMSPKVHKIFEAYKRE